MRRKTDLRGEPIRGGRKINPAEAQTVVRIFTQFSHGESPRAIARLLNAEGILGPGGRAWGDTTIRGHHERGTGILRNELYIGRLVWNRLRYVKDPVSGKRRSRLNPPSEWLVEDVPDLRIVDETLWEAVQRLRPVLTAPPEKGLEGSIASTATSLFCARYLTTS